MEKCEGMMVGRCSCDGRGYVRVMVMAYGKVGSCSTMVGRSMLKIRDSVGGGQIRGEQIVNRCLA